MLYASLDALLCVAVLLLLEALVVALWARSQLAGAYELGRALHSLVPLALAASLPLALCGAGLGRALERSDERGGRVVLAMAAAVLAGATAVGVSGGRLLAGGRRPVFVVVVTALAALAAFGGAPWLRVALARVEARGRLALVTLVCVAVALLELCNLQVLPRLYPAFHLALAALTVLCATLAGRALRRVEGRVRAVLGAILLLAGARAIGAPERLRLYDNIRFVYLDRAPLLAQAIRLAAVLAPPPAVDASPHPFGAPAAVRSLDWSGHDILLITIDALRADHVGAYGYGRPTTPAIDRLAREGVVFDAAYTATPHTSYAVASLMTGKYMRPLLRQEVGADSQTWAEALRRYDYRTAAFYPPAIFFVDRERFKAFEGRGLGFEYQKRQFSPAAERVGELAAYLAQPGQRGSRQLVWVHLFEPHEPYVPHPEHPFGDSNVDRYDSEVAAADAAVGLMVEHMRRVRPKTIVIVTADHGEEFGDHGGRYHGTTVYDEQVRVPLVVHAPGLLSPRRVVEPVSLVDLMPTCLSALGIPASPRVRGADLGARLLGRGEGTGFAFAETDEHTLLAEGALRLVCARKVGACRLFDTRADPAQRHDVAGRHAEAFSTMKRRASGFVASLGSYEGAGASWPQALRRGIAGDTDAAVEIAALLDDADVRTRRKAAEVLFELAMGSTAVHLRRALSRDEDAGVRRYAALGLTRMGQGAPLTLDLLTSGGDARWGRLAALVLAESGDARGELTLIDWWIRAYPEDPADAKETIAFERARQIAAALAKIRSKKAVAALGWALGDVRLRIHLARALEQIGDQAARPALGKAFAVEPYQDARVALARALVRLDGGAELREPLRRWLGVPDPLEGGLEVALRSGILPWVGGPPKRELGRLREYARSGVLVGLVVPEGGNGKGLRVIVRARGLDAAEGQVHFGPSLDGPVLFDRQNPIPKSVPKLDPGHSVTLRFAGTTGEGADEYQERHATLPPPVAAKIKPGEHADFVVYATQNVRVDAVAVVPLDDEPGVKR